MARHRVAAVTVALCLGVVTVLAAHDTWLLPSSASVRVGERVRLNLTSGMAFPADDFAILPNRIARADARLGATTTLLPRPTLRNQSLEFAWRPKVSGVATLVVDLKPKTLELTPDKIEEYFAEINAGPAIRAAWDSIPTPKRWRESYVKHAKTYIRVGGPEASSDSGWRSATGLRLEIIPERDPTSLRAGDTLSVRVVFEQRPLAGFQIGAIHEGTTQPAFATTGADGRARVPLPVPGRWLLNGTLLRRARERGLEWRSDFTTMTIAVASRQ